MSCCILTTKKLINHTNSAKHINEKSPGIQTIGWIPGDFSFLIIFTRGILLCSEQIISESRKRTTGYRNRARGRTQLAMPTAVFHSYNSLLQLIQLQHVRHQRHRAKLSQASARSSSNNR